MITTTDIKTISPYRLAKQLQAKFTYGIDDPDKHFYQGYYPAYLLLGTFLHLNTQYQVEGMTMDKLQRMNVEYVELYNNLLKQRYGRYLDPVLPSNFPFLRTLWNERKLSTREQSFLDALTAWRPDLDEDTRKHATLLILGCIEHTRRTWHDRIELNIKTASEILRMVEVGNKYIQEITGIEEFFSVETIEQTFKIK